MRTRTASSRLCCTDRGLPESELLRRLRMRGASQCRVAIPVRAQRANIRVMVRGGVEVRRDKVGASRHLPLVPLKRALLIASLLILPGVILRVVAYLDRIMAAPPRAASIEEPSEQDVAPG